MEKEFTQIISKKLAELSEAKIQKELLSKLKEIHLAILDFIDHKNTVVDSKAFTLTALMTIKDIFIKNQEIILKISEDQKNEFLKDIKNEILEYKKNTADIISKLSHSDIDPIELEQVETKYKRLHLLLEEKTELEEKYNAYKNVDFGKLEEEVTLLNNQIALLEAKEKTYTEQKIKLEQKAKKIKKLETDLAKIKEVTKENLDTLIVTIDNSVALVKKASSQLYEERIMIFEKTELETNKLKALKIEIDALLKNLEAKKEEHLYLTNLAKKNLYYDVQIIDNIPAISEKTGNRVKALTNEIAVLEKELRGYMKKLQEEKDLFFKNKFYA